MIGQYLSNTNESATVSILQKFSELNKASTDKAKTFAFSICSPFLPSSYGLRAHQWEGPKVTLIAWEGGFGSPARARKALCRRLDSWSRHKRV